MKEALGARALLHRIALEASQTFEDLSPGRPDLVPAALAQRARAYAPVIAMYDDFIARGWGGYRGQVARGLMAIFQDCGVEALKEARATATATFVIDQMSRRPFESADRIQRAAVEILRLRNHPLDPADLFPPNGVRLPPFYLHQILRNFPESQRGGVTLPLQQAADEQARKLGSPERKRPAAEALADAAQRAFIGNFAVGEALFRSAWWDGRLEQVIEVLESEPDLASQVDTISGENALALCRQELEASKAALSGTARSQIDSGSVHSTL